jgi:presenilin-like A22 family membrane protease
LILLVVLAVYDAISVYKTKHMVTLAEGVIDIKAPLLFVVPKRGGYSFRKEQMLSSENGRGAFFLGLGDAIIPTVLVISANWSLQAPVLLGLGLNAPALGAMLGTYIGFAALMTTSRDKPQAGLPFLNGGTVLGFLAGCVLSGVRPF